MNWLKITWFQYRQDNPEHIFFKGSNNESEPFRKIEVVRRTKTRPLLNFYSLQPMYSSPIPISNEKLKDLMELCNMGIIREQYHLFYNLLTFDQQQGREVEQKIDVEDVDEN